MNIFTQNRRKGDLFTNIGIFSSFLLVSAIGVYIYSPTFGSHAGEAAKTRLEAVVNPVASITLDTDDLVFSVSPTAEGAFESDSVTATVSTNSLGGYELYFSAVDDNTDMVHDNESVTDVISSSFSGTVTSSTMPANSWGYSLDNVDFVKIPTATDQLKVNDIDHYPETAERDNVIYFGTKITTELASGSYSKDVKFTVLAHDTPVAPTFYSIEYMQDMTPGVCLSATTPSKTATQFDWDGSHEGDDSYVPRKTLIDSRDGKAYLVSKLADGNCWMSQNLALDIVEDEEIIISNNDGTTDTVVPDKSADTSEGAGWDQPGEWQSFQPQGEGLYYLEGKTASSTPTAAGVEYAWESAGYYYNWYTATGSSGTGSMESGDAPSSICPKGWRLPTSEGSKSLYNLFANGYGLELLTEAAGTALRADPLNFVLSGGYSYITSAMAHTGETGNGFYWMSTAYSGSQAYRMSSKLTYIKPQGNYDKGYGFPIRCVSI